MKLSDKQKEFLLDEIGVVWRAVIKMGGASLVTHGYFGSHGDMIAEGIGLIAVGLLASLLDKWTD